jgi:hypothetical protein
MTDYPVDTPMPKGTATPPDFRAQLEGLINRHSMENGSDTPDFILAQYLVDCLGAFDRAAHRRTEWYKPNERTAAPAL